MDPSCQECDHDDSHRYGRAWIDPVRQAWSKALPVPASTLPALQSLTENYGKRLELFKAAVPKSPVCGFVQSDLATGVRA